MKKNFIAGEWREAASCTENINPSDTIVCSKIADFTVQPSLSLRAGFDEGKLITTGRALEAALDVVDERPSLG